MNRNTKTALIIGAVILALLIAMPMIWGGPVGWSDGGWHMMGSGTVSYTHLTLPTTPYV